MKRIFAVAALVLALIVGVRYSQEAEATVVADYPQNLEKILTPCLVLSVGTDASIPENSNGWYTYTVDGGSTDGGTAPDGGAILIPVNVTVDAGCLKTAERYEVYSSTKVFWTRGSQGLTSGNPIPSDVPVEKTFSLPSDTSSTVYWHSPSGTAAINLCKIKTGRKE